MLKKFSLEWAFEACLEAEQEPLRLKLKTPDNRLERQNISGTFVAP